MPIQETCAVCGLDLLWINSDRLSGGGYVHLFTEEKAHLYKSIHIPVAQVEDPSLNGEFDLMREDSVNRKAFNTRGKVEPRASVAPEAACGDLRAKEKQDVRIVAHFLKAIFLAR